MLELARYQMLFYDYVEDVLEKRAPHREVHLAYAREARAAGRLVAGGALGDPPHGGALVFSVENASEVEEFARGDPYVEAGIVTAWRVEPWNVVV
jgi:uncharacterized protein YciI